MENSKVNIDGIDIAYVRRGAGKPLVLIHGYPLDHTIWDSAAPLLAEDFELILPDLRGFGESDAMEADHSIIGYASDLAGVLDRLRIRKAYIAGHSMGGYVALAFAREFPRRVSGLGMISSQMIADTEEKKEGRYATAKEVMEAGIQSVVESMTPKMSAKADVQALVQAIMSRQRPAGVASALRAMADRPDSLDVFAAFKFPVVIVHGDVDALIPVERAREMKATLSAAHYVELAGAGHVPMLEQPDAVAEALKFFVNVKLKGVKFIEP